MIIKLEDIIDLDYLIGKDEALSSEGDIRVREEKDKKIFDQSRETCRTDKALLLSWLEARRQEFFREKEVKGVSLLPGRVFSSLYSFMVYAMVFFGGITGLSLAWSFLAYHGTRPVNVALFIFLFILLQVVLITITVFLLIKRHLMIRSEKGFFKDSIIHTLLSFLFFNVLPEFLKKTDWRIVKKGADTLEYTSTLIRMKNREYSELFFWPFFILTSVFSFSFATSTLIGTFFRVIISDMAFGWQSTLMTTSIKIHQLVSLIALPWSWFMPESLAYPTLEQIEGSRIILKDGISVLATQDLVSWWPFLCLGIFFYAVLPRTVMMVAGIVSQTRVLRHFNLDRPVFRALMIQMPHDSQTAAQETFILVPGKVYSDGAMDKIAQTIKIRLFFDVKEIFRISVDPEQDSEVFNRLGKSGIDQVVLVHEVWQPPIRGLLYYIRQLKSAMPEKGLLWILLTQDAGQENLCVDENDADFEIWKKAVFTLGDPGIKVRRL